MSGQTKAKNEKESGNKKMNIQVLNQWVNENERVVYIIYIVVVVLLIAAFIRSLGESKMAEKEKQYLSVYHTLVRQNYEALKARIDLARKLRHDIANHLYVLEQLEESGREKETLEYRAWLEKQYAKLKQTGYCRNTMADAVICQKAKLCGEKGISFEVHLEELDVEGMEEIDCMQLFFELIDYGIDALEKRQTTEKKMMLTAKQKAGYGVLELQAEPVGKKRLGSQTTLKGVGDILERYGGFMEESRERGKMTVQAAVRNSR